MKIFFRFSQMIVIQVQSVIRNKLDQMQLYVEYENQNYNFQQRLIMETEQPLQQTELNGNFLSSFEKVQSFTGSLNIFPSHIVSQHNDQCSPQNGQSEKSIQKSKKQLGCSNKLCKSHSEANKSEGVQISLETLCNRCQEQFQKDSYCIYCKQIYFDETDDGKEWIMCEQCSRWVHSTCADFNTRENPNAVFQCIKCKKIDAQPSGRRNIPRAGYAKLQKKKNSQFLNSIGFDWQLTALETSEDMQNIRRYLG